MKIYKDFVHVLTEISASYMLPKDMFIYITSWIRIRSESELFNGDTSKDTHSPGPVTMTVEASLELLQEKSAL